MVHSFSIYWHWLKGLGCEMWYSDVIQHHIYWTKKYVIAFKIHTDQNQATKAEPQQDINLYYLHEQDVTCMPQMMLLFPWFVFLWKPKININVYQYKKMNRYQIVYSQPKDIIKQNLLLRFSKRLRPPFISLSSFACFSVKDWKNQHS